MWRSNPNSEKEYAQRFVSLTNKNVLYDAAEVMMLDKYVRWRGSASHKQTILQDACEAVVGAIFLDSGIEFTLRFISKIWSQIHVDDFATIDPKSILQDWANKLHLTLIYEVVEDEGPPHDKKYMVRLTVTNYNQVYGVGSSIRAAEKEAASKFIQQSIQKPMQQKPMQQPIWQSVSIQKSVPVENILMQKSTKKPIGDKS